MREDEAIAAIVCWGKNHWRGAGGAAPPAVTVEAIAYCAVEQWWEARLAVAGQTGSRHVIFWQSDIPYCGLLVSIREEVMV